MAIRAIQSRHTITTKGAEDVDVVADVDKGEVEAEEEEDHYTVEEEEIEEDRTTVGFTI